MDAVEHLGDRDVGALAGGGPGAQRGAEAGAGRIGAGHRDQERVPAPLDVGDVDVGAAGEDAGGVAVEAQAFGVNEPAGAADAPVIGQRAVGDGLAHGAASEHEAFNHEQRRAGGEINGQAAREAGATIVFVVCDRGDRYLSTGVFPA